MGRRRFRLLVLLALVISVILRVLVAPNPLYGAVHDDELMVRLASSILRGEWLGNYSTGGHLILSKPPGYPIFLAVVSVLPWAPTVSIHLLLLLGVMITARELRLFGLGRPSVLFFVVAGSLNPQWYGYQMSRIYRDGLLAALTFVALGLSLMLGRLLRELIMTSALPQRIAALTSVVALANGFVLSITIITKPSWYPIAILTVLIVGQRAICAELLVWRRSIPKLAVVSFAFLLGTTSLISYVIHQNSTHYGVSEIDSFSHGSFPAAFKSWSSVETGERRKYVLVNSSQREAVYRESATARLLRPHLEMSWGQGWRGSACSSPLKICDETATWFVWELRDAMHLAGQDSSAVLFEEGFARLRSEIEQACSSDRLRCNSGGLAPGVVPLRNLSKREIIEAFSTSFEWLMFPETGGTARGGPASGDPTMLKAWDRVAKGLPSRDSLPEYRPEVLSIGNTINLLSRGFGLSWPLAILLALYSFVMTRPLEPLHRKRTVLSMSVFLGLLLFIGQLALLEASSGMYLSTGRQLYLLPAFPFVTVMLALELSKLERSNCAVSAV